MIFKVKQFDWNMDYIDTRSDTVTVPTLKMREAMRDAKVGDDVYGEDPTINHLTRKASDLFGMEAAIFVPSGVMSNQLAIMGWTTPGDEIILWERCHIAQYENGSTGRLSGVQTRTVESESGILTAEEVRHFIRKSKGIMDPKTALICIQNSLGNGRVWSLESLKQIKKLAEEHGIKVHTDGARIFNAAVALGVEVSELAQYTDSISFCISKGLCCPYGSLLLGPRDFIQKANYNKKALGGGIRQGGFLAAAGIVALDQMVPQIPKDHRMAKLLAYKLSKIEGIQLDLNLITTNIVFFDIDDTVSNKNQLPKALMSKRIKFNSPACFKRHRIVTHHYINEGEVQLIAQEIQKFVRANRQHST